MDDLIRHAEAAANGSGEDFADWYEKSMHEVFLSWLAEKQWSYDDDLKAAFIAGYEKGANESLALLRIWGMLVVSRKRPGAVDRPPGLP